MKLLEVLIACFIFSVVSGALSLLLFSSQSFLEWAETRRFALAFANELMEEASDPAHIIDGAYTADVVIKKVDNFTNKKEVRVSYVYRNRPQEIILFVFETNVVESKGQSSCRPTQDISKWSNPEIRSFDISTIVQSIKPTDIDVVGTYVFISSNSSAASSSDLYIFDIRDTQNVRLVSTIDTGPGLASLSVAGDYVYLANTSVNGQLQIVDVSDLSTPYLVSTYKLPGGYNDATVGNSIFYKEGKVFLGTQKSQINELHHIDVSDPAHPHEKGAYEIGNAINDIFVFKDKVYVASPHSDEMKSFTLSQSGAFIPFASYNNPGSTGNGKRLSLFLDTLYVGKTQTFAREELLALQASSSPALLFGRRLGSSVEGVIGYGSLLFIILHRTSDNFQVFNIVSNVPSKINNTQTIPANPLNFDCDQDTFVVISENSTLLTFIKQR